MKDETVLMPSPTEDAEAKEEGLCTGRFTTGSLFLSFVYAASVYLYSFLAVKAPLQLLPIASAIPNFVVLIIFKKVFGKRASCMQSFYVFLSALSFALPLLACLPLLRHGSVLVVGLLDIAASASNVFVFLKPGFLLWALLDAFALRACPQEAFKFGVCYQLRDKQKVYNLQNMIFYAAVAATTFSLAMTTNDSLRLVYQFSSASEGPQEAHRLGTLWIFAVFHGAFELPSQILTALLIACSLTAAGKETGSFFVHALWKPILLHGIPAFSTQLARHVSQNVAAKYLWGLQVEAIPPHALRAVAAVTALCQFVSTAVMIGSLLIGLVGCRRAYLHAKAKQDYSCLVVERPPRFLFSLEDILHTDDEDEDAHASLLVKEGDNQA